MKWKLDHRRYAPAVLSLIICLASKLNDFVSAETVLKDHLNIQIGDTHIGNLVEAIGGEMITTRRKKTETYRNRLFTTPPPTASPRVPLAAVMVDGGRVQTREVDRPPGVHDPRWRETKVGLCVRMDHQEFTTDPHPRLPHCFRAPGERDTPDTEPPMAWPSQPIFRTCLATLDSSEEFGWHLAAEAHERGFFTAAKKVFLGDGQKYNWSIRDKHFTDFEPILDFVHAMEYVHKAARAVDQPELAYRWVEKIWSGEIEDVIRELQSHQDQFTEPDNRQDRPDDPWVILQSVLSYFRNNRQRMNYPRYRVAGLPISSAPVESLIRQLNQRVKGPQKFWGRTTEAILEIQAASLCEDNRLAKHLASRPGHPWSRVHQTPATIAA